MSILLNKCYIENVDKWGRFKVIFKDASPESINILNLLRNENNPDKLPIYDWFLYSKPGKILEKKDTLLNKYVDIECNISRWIYNGKSGRNIVIKNIRILS